MPNTATYILANRDILSIERARLYLAGRLRVRTPRGAAEFLTFMKAGERDGYNGRLSLALDCLEIYRDLFSEEYARSTAPLFSQQREHEFYRLVHTKLFPLRIDDSEDLLSVLDREPRLLLPFIPVSGLQKHIWDGGCFHFCQIELCYRVAQVLSGKTGADGSGWKALAVYYGLPGTLSPSRALACVGWSLFADACAIAGPPLQYLPLAFNMISCATGNVWLDTPLLGCLPVEWTKQQVARLALMRQQADQAFIAIRVLNQWMEEDPPARITQIVELWNDAYAKEQDSGYGGMLVHDLVEAGAMPLGPDLVALPETFRRRLQELEAGI